MAQGSDIRVRLQPDGVKDVVAALRQVQKESDGLSGSLRATFARLVPTIGFTAAAAGLTALVRSAAAFEDSMLKTSQRVGASVEDFSALAHAASTADVSVQELEVGMVQLARRTADFKSGTGEAASAFQELGFTARDFGNNTGAALDAVARRIGSLPDGLDKSRLAVEIFGRAGARLIPLLNDIAQRGLPQIRAEAASLGALVRGETSEAAAEFNDNLTRLNTAAASLGRNLTRRLIGPLAEISRAVAEAARESGILAAAWVALGGAAALALGRTDSQQANALAEEIKRVEERANRTRDMLERGRIAAVKFLGVQLTPEVDLSATGRASLTENLQRDLALVEQLRARLAALQAQSRKPTDGPGVGDSTAALDARQRLAALEKQLGQDQLRGIEELAKRREALASIELQQAQRLAEARATSAEQVSRVELEVLRQQEALARQSLQTDIQLAQTKEAALADLAARTTARGRTQAELLAAIGQQSLNAQLSAQQRYFDTLAKLNADHLKRFTDSQAKIRQLDEELAQSRIDNQRTIDGFRRQGLTEAQRLEEDLRRAQQVRTDFGAAVLRGAGNEARALKQTFDELFKSLGGTQGFENAMSKLNDDVQSLFKALISTEQAKERALGQQAAEGVRRTNSELEKTKGLITDLSRDQVTITPVVQNEALGKLRDQIQGELERQPFRINVAPVVGPASTTAPGLAGGGRVPGSSPHPRADNVPIMATAGEYVHNVAAVRHYGLPFMQAVNARRFSITPEDMHAARLSPVVARYADGGMIKEITAGANVYVRQAFAGGGLVEAQARDVSVDDGPADMVVELRSSSNSARVRTSRQQVRELQRVLEDVGRGTVKK